jgi:hypothetical protein
MFAAHDRRGGAGRLIPTAWRRPEPPSARLRLLSGGGRSVRRRSAGGLKTTMDGLRELLTL